MENRKAVKELVSFAKKCFKQTKPKSLEVRRVKDEKVTEFGFPPVVLKSKAIVKYIVCADYTDLIGGYYNISKLVGVQSSNNNREMNDKFHEIEAEFPLLISKAIDYVCDEIPLTPEEFIEDTINWSIVNIMVHIKKERYDFLDKYKDFSTITESIDQIYKKNLL